MSRLKNQSSILEGMRKIDSEKADDLRLKKQVLECFTSIPGLLSEVSPEQIINDAIKKTESIMRQKADEGSEFAQETVKEWDFDKEIAKSARDDQPEVKPEAEERVHYQTSLFKKVFEPFAALMNLISARTKNDPQLLADCDRKARIAQKALDALHAQTSGDLKDVTAQAVKECAVSALIARSDDLSITREKAHAMLGQER